MPKQILFSTFPSRRPAHGPHRRWKDCVVGDLRARGLEEGWLEASKSRSVWRASYTLSVEDRPRPAPVACSVCSRVFARPGDRARHKCKAERAKPVAEQRGACKCSQCGHWFRSRGGLAVHHCAKSPPVTISSPVDASALLCCAAHCSSCGRCFRSVPGRSRHRCSRLCPRPSLKDRSGFTHICACSRRFRLLHHLNRHQAACSSLSIAPSGPT